MDQAKVPRHLALLSKFQYLGALEAALITQRYEVSRKQAVHWSPIVTIPT